jgi:hypothetical protein
MVELSTGVETALGTDMYWGTWSPDGRWIAVKLAKWGNGDVVLVDSSNPTKRHRVGSAEGQVVWSPDSKLLLSEKGQISCAVTLYGASLQVIDVEASKSYILKSSHCRIAAGSFFWVDASAVR